MKLHLKSILDNISADHFTWTDDWERGWNAQPKPGTRHFIGVGSPAVPGAERHNLTWKPQARELTLWRGGQKATVKFSPATAARLSRLIEEKLSGQQKAGEQCRPGCPCRCHPR